ncbi:MAG: YdeI/OmpD-associated family protein [Candidatus Saccharibacteria bacterium]
MIVELDDKPRDVEVPADFAVALKAANLHDRFDAIAYSHRKEYIVWIESAKREETRASRLTKALDMIGQGLKAKN